MLLSLCIIQVNQSECCYVWGIKTYRPVYRRGEWWLAVDKKSKTLSFIIPAKNEEEHLGRCLKSLFVSIGDRSDCEIIVIDNGSTDNTAEIARSAGVRLFNRPGMTVSALRNLGARVAEGKLLAFVDADVTVAEDWVETALKLMRPGGVAMVGTSPGIPEDSRWVARAWQLQVLARRQRCRRQWLESMNMVVRKEVFQSVGGFDETLVTCEDVDLGYKIGESFQIWNDSSLRAVHYGEAQTLRHFFRKELWRGTSNFKGAWRHGLVISEVPSLVQPLLTLFGGGLLVASLLTQHLLIFLAGLFCLCLFPALKALMIAIRAGAMSKFLSLFAIWGVYSLARTTSFVVECKDLLVSLAPPTLLRIKKAR